MHNAMAIIGMPFILVFLMLAQIGCAPVIDQPSASTGITVPTIPTRWSEWSAADSTVQAGATSLDQWWLRFSDPLLESLVTRSMQANTSVNGARAALRQARALRDVSAAALWPSIDGSASAQRSKSGSDSAVDRFAVGLDASWEVDIFGANRSALDSSEATAWASAADLGDVQVSIAAEVALAYIALRETQAQLAIANDNLASQLETLQITLWRLQAGLTLGSLTNSASVVSALLADAFMPVFDGTGRRAQVRAEQAALDQALAVYQAAVLTALLDVEDALVALRGDRESLQSLETAAEAAGNAAQLARQQYSSGLVDFQTVLDTQRSQLRTQASVASALADISADHVRLYKALVGGWRADGSDEPPPQPKTPPGVLPYESSEPSPRRRDTA